MGLEDLSWIWLVLGGAAFLAGLIDAAVGGGGLIQVPALLLAFPQAPLADLFGTNKVASVVGTAAAARQYLRRIALPGALLATVATAAGLGSWFGASAVTHFPREWARPMVLVLLSLVAVYTFAKKDFGLHSRTAAWERADLSRATGIGLVIGFYDGFFGPGTGSFFIFAFVRLLRLDFLHASALAKVGNVATNVAAIAYFWGHAHIAWALGGWLALCNVLGSRVGSGLALRHGSGFVRKLFLVVVTVLIVRLSWEQLSPYLF